MENITTLYLLYIQYLNDKAEQCMHIEDWEALSKVKEIIKRDFENR